MLFSSDFGLRIENLDVQLSCSLHDFHSLSDRYSATDFCSKLAVVHDQHFQVRSIADSELAESIGQDIPVRSIGSISNLDHLEIVSISPTHTRVDTLGSAPLVLWTESGKGEAAGPYGHTKKLVSLMTDELLESLLDDLGSL